MPKNAEQKDAPMPPSMDGSIDFTGISKTVYNPVTKRTDTIPNEDEFKKERLAILTGLAEIMKNMNTK